jgi:hypothetical protein
MALESHASRAKGPEDATSIEIQFPEGTPEDLITGTGSKVIETLVSGTTSMTNSTGLITIESTDNEPLRIPRKVFETVEKTVGANGNILFFKKDQVNPEALFPGEEA